MKFGIAIKLCILISFSMVSNIHRTASIEEVMIVMLTFVGFWLVDLYLEGTSSFIRHLSYGRTRGLGFSGSTR